MTEVGPDIQAASSRRNSGSMGQIYCASPGSQTDVLSRMSALGSSQLSPPNKTATANTSAFKWGSFVSSAAIEDLLKQNNSNDHRELSGRSTRHESGNSLQDYSRLVATNYSMAGRSSSEGNETNILMDVPGYMSTNERRRLLTADPVALQRTSSRSSYDAPSWTGSWRPAQSLADEPSASSVWTDTLNHYGLGYDSMLDNPSLVGTSGEGMREMLDRKLTYQNDDHKKAGADSFDARSVHSTETEYQMLPPAMSPGRQMPSEQQRQTRWQQPSALAVSCSISEPSEASLVPATYATPPLRASRDHSAPGTASGYSLPVTSVTAAASPRSSSAAMQVLRAVGGGVAPAHASSGGGNNSSAGNRSADTDIRGKDDAYLPMDPFSDTSYLSTHADNSIEKRPSRASRATEQAANGHGLSTPDQTPTLSDLSCGTLSVVSLTASDDSESDDKQSSGNDSGRDRLLLHTTMPSASKAAAVIGSNNSRIKAVVSSPLRLASTAIVTAVRGAARPGVVVSRAWAPGTSESVSVASTSALVSSRLDHIEAMVMKALERRQPDVPNATLQRSISETIRQMQPGVSPAKNVELVVAAAPIESARSSACPSVGPPVTSALGRDGRSQPDPAASAVTSLLSSKIDIHVLPNAEAGALSQRALVQPLKDLSLNLSLLPDRTLPAFPAFSSATQFLSEQLKYRAGEKTPGRAVHKTSHRDEVPPSNLSDQENKPKLSRDGQTARIDQTADQNGKVSNRGSLLHLQPYKPAGSRALTYVASHTVDDTLSMTTTVESTHTDSDDARPPFLPVDALGSRFEPAHRAPGIYGTRKRAVEHNQSSAAHQRQLPNHPHTASYAGRETGRETSEEQSRPEPATSGELSKLGAVSAVDIHCQQPGTERGSAEYAQKLRDRADKLLKLKDQLAGHDTDAADEVESVSRTIKERIVETLPATESGELHAIDPQSIAAPGSVLRSQALPPVSGSTYAKASSVACEPQLHLPSRLPIPERNGLRSDDRHSSADPRGLRAINSAGAREQLPPSALTRCEATGPTHLDYELVSYELAADGDCLPAGSAKTGDGSIRVQAAADVPLPRETRLPSHAASNRRLLGMDPLSNGRDATSNKMSAAVVTGPTQRRPVGVRSLGSATAGLGAAAGAGAAADLVTKPGATLVGSSRTQSLLPAHSPKSKAGISSRPTKLRSSSASPSPLRSEASQGHLFKPLLGQHASPISSVRNPSHCGRGINQNGGTKPGSRLPVEVSTTSSALRSKLADVIKDRQLTYRVLIDELTNAEDVHKRNLLNQAWDEIHQKKKDESSLSDEKLERLCDLLRNPLRHLVTKGKETSNRTTPSSDIVSGPERHLEALRSAVLRQKSVITPRPQTADRCTSPMRRGLGDDRRVAIAASAGEHDNENADDVLLASRQSGHRAGDVTGKPLTAGKEDGGMLSTPAAMFSNAARAAPGRLPVKPAMGGDGGLVSWDTRAQAVRTSFTHHRSHAGLPVPEFMSAKGEDRQQLLQMSPSKASVPFLSYNSRPTLGQQTLRHKRQDNIMWYQPFSRKNVEANTYEKARQLFTENRGCSWFLPLGQPKPWKRSPAKRRANRLGHEPWYPSALGVPAAGVTGHPREGRGITASGGLLISAAERRLLQELDQACLDAGNRDIAQSRSGGLDMEGDVQRDNSSTASSLQEAFARRKQEFISRSRERQRRVALRSEERAINSLHDAEREKLFGLRAPLTAAAGEKLPGAGCATTASAGGAKSAAARPSLAPWSYQPSGGLGARLDAGPRGVARQRRRQLGLFVLQPRRAAISKHEMYERTRRMCTELPEERQRDVTLRRRQECAAHRTQARLFNKSKDSVDLLQQKSQKVLHSVLRKATVVKKTRK